MAEPSSFRYFAYNNIIHIIEICSQYVIAHFVLQDSCYAEVFGIDSKVIFTEKMRTCKWFWFHYFH